MNYKEYILFHVSCKIDHLDKIISFVKRIS